MFGESESETESKFTSKTKEGGVKKEVHCIPQIHLPDTPGSVHRPVSPQALDTTNIQV